MRLIVMLSVFLAACEFESRARIADIQAKQLADGVCRFKTIANRWPGTIAEMAPPRCRDKECILEAVPSDPWSEQYVLRATADGQLVVSAGSSHATIVAPLPCGQK